MATQINGLNGAQPQAARERGRTDEVAASNVADNPSSRPESNPSGDRVSLTGAAMRMQQLEQGLESHSGINEERVAEIRQAIENGTLQIDARRIASTMLDLERALSNG